jgi:hypothetical protein
MGVQSEFLFLSGFVVLEHFAAVAYMSPDIKSLSVRKDGWAFEASVCCSSVVDLSGFALLEVVFMFRRGSSPP